MKRFWAFFLLTAILLIGYSNCAPVKFEGAQLEIASEPTPFVEPEPEPEPEPVPLTERKLCTEFDFVQPNLPKVDKLDLLFVIDTSGSLDVERPLIAQEVDAFLQELPADVKTNVAVVLGHSSLSNQTGRLYQVDINDPPVLKSENMTNAEIRMALARKMSEVVIDNSADGGEEGLFAFNQLLEPVPLATAQDLGFFRADAALSVVFIGDEADICARNANGDPLALTSGPRNIFGFPTQDTQELTAYNRDCQDISPEKTLAKLKNLKPDLPLLLSSITYLDAANGEVGNGYLELVDLNQGIKANLADNAFNTDLQKIGEKAGERLALLEKISILENKVADGLHDIDADSIMVIIDDTEVEFTLDEVEEGLLHLIDPGKPDSVVEVYFCETPVLVNSETGEIVEVLDTDNEEDPLEN